MNDSPKKSTPIQSKASKLKILLLLISTNTLSIYLFSSASPFHLNWAPQCIQSWPSLSLAHQLNSTQAQLSSAQSQLSSLHTLIQTLLAELGPASNYRPDERARDLHGELKLVVGPHKLPFGHTANIGSDQLYPSLGSQCLKFKDELAQYMDYQIGSECPSDDVFSQRLMLKGCEPLPRRRCHPKSPKNYVGPARFPDSLWAIPSDTSISWDPYTCKNYTCLVNRKNAKGSYDCKDCFDLNGREKTRWMFDTNGLDYGLDAVLALKPPGTIRIGLDIGGGSGTFAARMRERNVTIVTSTMNFDGPFNSFIASRGLISMHISVSNRLPFFENTLDIVHSMHVLSNWIPDVMLEFALYDIYRVLRPGGLFWLDHFFSFGEQLNVSYVPMFERVGFTKVRWNVGRKMDRGLEKDEWYLSALLEKPMT